MMRLIIINGKRVEARTKPFDLFVVSHNTQCTLLTNGKCTVIGDSLLLIRFFDGGRTALHRQMKLLD